MNNNFVVKQILPNIFHVRFSSKLNQNSTMLRFQEHYESPKFKGKYFTLVEFKKWYVSNTEIGKKYGFNYYTYWLGFNIPSSVLKPFYNEKFKPLSTQELDFLNKFKDKRKERFYIISTPTKLNLAIINHEIAHALFYTDSNYRRKTTMLINKLDKNTKTKLKDYLLKELGYNKSVLIDEMQAYLLCNKQIMSDIKINKIILTSINQKLKEIYKKSISDSRML